MWQISLDKIPLHTQYQYDEFLRILSINMPIAQFMNTGQSAPLYLV